MPKSTQPSSACLPASLSQSQAPSRDDANKTQDSHDKATGSIFSRSAPTYNVPMRVIHRPLPSELDEDKVQAFMAGMQVSSRVISL